MKKILVIVCMCVAAATAAMAQSLPQGLGIQIGFAEPIMRLNSLDPNMPKDSLVNKTIMNGVGLFGYIDSPAIIKNITLDNTCSLLGNRFVGIVGSVVGDLSGEVTMSGIGYEGSIDAAGATAAGILGCALSAAHASGVP